MQRQGTKQIAMRVSPSMAFDLLPGPRTNPGSSFTQHHAKQCTPILRACKMAEKKTISLQCSLNSTGKVQNIQKSGEEISGIHTMTAKWFFYLLRKWAGKNYCNWCLKTLNEQPTMYRTRFWRHSVEKSLVKAKTTPTNNNTNLCEPA